jgi:hypothetical protein
MSTKSTIASTVLLALAGAAAVSAQSSGSYTDVPDRFRLEVGGFRVGADTKLTLNRRGESDTVDFESDLDLEDSGTRAFVEGYWRVGRRHLLSLSYQRFKREGDGKTLERTIEWGDQTYPVGVTAKGSTSSDYVSGAYRFAAYRNDRFEIGPALGIGYLWMKAGIETTASVGGASRTSNQEASTNSATGNLGAYVYAWPGRRFLLRGDFRYILVKPGNSEASIVEGRAGLLWHPVPKVAIGLQYVYTKFRYDRGLLETSLGGSVRFSGGQLVAGYVF